jgi:hypothetical protein
MKNTAYSATPVLLSLVACTSVTPPAAVAPPPDLAIASVHVAGTPAENTWTPQAPVQLALGCDHNPLLVQVTPEPDGSSYINGFQIAPPGDCSNTSSCGWFVLRVDPGQSSENTVPTWLTPITADGALEPGVHVMTLELHDWSDHAWLGSDNTPLGDTVNIEFLAPILCPTEQGDAGLP